MPECVIPLPNMPLPRPPIEMGIGFYRPYRLKRNLFYNIRLSVRGSSTFSNVLASAFFNLSRQRRHLLRTQSRNAPVYYTQAYSAWQKGSVENFNRQFRRHYGKGTDFSKVSTRAIAQAVADINNVPRQTSLKGLTANEAFSRAC